MKTRKVYDCSNSAERPPHRSENYGPKENDIMRGLKKYANVFDYEFIDNPTNADVIITNDIFPKDILSINKPRVKRMDGIFWQKAYLERNEPLKQAAMEADWVIFISEYSELSFRKLYHELPKNHMVITNCVDSSVYFPLPKKFIPLQWVACASNWAREEKRFNDLMVFATEIIQPTSQLILIGHCDMKVPSNVDVVGYIEDEREMNRFINFGHMFVNLSYRDPCPKVVCQASNCHMPVFYANSGGTKEVVNAGVGIVDPEISDEVPRLNIDNMKQAYMEFKSNFRQLQLQARSTKANYMEMLGSYFWVMDNAITGKLNEQG